MQATKSSKTIRLVSTQEIKEVIQDCKRKMWSHLEERQSFQVNEKFISYMEQTISELNQVLESRKVA